MPYTNCSACGAKALVGATRCPRCEAPFVSYAVGGERVPTVNCPNCGVQRPVAIGVCPNCLMSTAPSGRRLARGLILTGIGIAVILTIGYVMSRRTEQLQSAPAPVASVADTGVSADSMPSYDSATVMTSDTSQGAASLAPAPSQAPRSANTTTVAATARTAPPPAVPSASSLPMSPRPAPLPTVTVPDTGRWEYATANTWVRVRSAPTRNSDVLRMVDSAQRVRLGPPLNGWRSVRVGTDRGWVDPRLFSIVPPPRP